jgi:hypothetical protein
MNLLRFLDPSATIPAVHSLLAPAQAPDTHRRASGSAALELAGLGSASLGFVVINVLALIACVTVHEFGHAYVADRLGDPLPRQQGRVTLNPLAHIDWLGTVIFPALMAMGAGIPLAWGKPVEWTGNPRLSDPSLFDAHHSADGVDGRTGDEPAAGARDVGVADRRWTEDSQRRTGPCEQPPRADELVADVLQPAAHPAARWALVSRVFAQLQWHPVRDFLLRYGSFVFLALVLLGTGSGVSPLGWLMSPFEWLIRKYVELLLTHRRLMPLRDPAHTEPAVAHTNAHSHRRKIGLQRSTKACDLRRLRSAL